MNEHLLSAKLRRRCRQISSRTWSRGRQREARQAEDQCRKLGSRRSARGHTSCLFRKTGELPGKHCQRYAGAVSGTSTVVVFSGGGGNYEQEVGVDVGHKSKTPRAKANNEVLGDASRLCRRVSGERQNLLCTYRLSSQIYITDSQSNDRDTMYGALSAFASRTAVRPRPIHELGVDSNLRTPY